MANNQSVRRHLDAFTRGRMIGKLEEGRSVTRTAIRGFSSGRPAEEPHPQMTGTLSYRPEETGGRQRGEIARHTTQVTDDRYRVLPWPEDCTVVVCLHDALYGVPLTPAHRSTIYDLNPIEHVWGFSGRRLAARTLPPVTIQELRLALQDEWAAMPQQLIDTLILSMGRRCETRLAVREIISPTKDRMLLADTHHRDVSAFSRIALHATFSIKASFIPLISLLVSVAYITHVLTYWGS
ncbi:hypothetical protein TNCV_247551 [Trichonephila clavipes]|nr:hypothetical protein TNCV_247551 [Trichonephila clavipes]